MPELTAAVRHLNCSESFSKSLLLHKRHNPSNKGRNKYRIGKVRQRVRSWQNLNPSEDLTGRCREQCSASPSLLTARLAPDCSPPALTGTQLPGHHPLNDLIGGFECHLMGWGFRDRT